MTVDRLIGMLSDVFDTDAHLQGLGGVARRSRRDVVVGLEPPRQRLSRPRNADRRQFVIVRENEIPSVDSALMKLSAPPFPLSVEAARRWLTEHRSLIREPMRVVADLANEAIEHEADRRELAAAGYLVAADLLDEHGYVAVAQEYRDCAWWLAPVERAREGNADGK